MTADGPAYTADGIWRVSFPAPHAAAQELLERLDDLALSVSVSELDGDGGDPAPVWRVELLVGGQPDMTALAAALRAHCAACSFELGEVAVEPLPPTDWLRAVAQQSRPFRVGRFVVHGNEARDRVEPAAIAIEVDAGLAFGSGEHETTRGCLEAIDRPSGGRRPRRILDLGCGSGILAIAAAKRWPRARVLAVDNDPLAVRVAALNMQANRVAGRVRVAPSDGMAAAAVRRGAPYDLILANILADPLIAMAGDIARQLRSGGEAVLAGLLDRQAADVLSAFATARLRLQHRRDLGAWSILQLRKVGRGRDAG